MLTCFIMHVFMLCSVLDSPNLIIFHITFNLIYRKLILCIRNYDNNLYERHGRGGLFQVASMSLHIISYF